MGGGLLLTERMLEQKHSCFGTQCRDIHVISGETAPEEVQQRILEV